MSWETLHLLFGRVFGRVEFVVAGEEQAEEAVRIFETRFRAWAPAVQWTMHRSRAGRIYHRGAVGRSYRMAGPAETTTDPILDAWEPAAAAQDDEDGDAVDQSPGDEWVEGTIVGHRPGNFGFIQADDGKEDVHFHSRRLPVALRDVCMDGRRVQCRLRYRQDRKRHTREVIVADE